MNSNLWIKRILGIATAIALMVTIMAIPSPAGAAPQASATQPASGASAVSVSPASQTQMANTPAPIQPTVAGDENWNGQFMLGADDDVLAMAFAPNGDLYIGGRFHHVAGISADYLAKWSASSNQWSAVGSGVNINVNALAFSGNTLYIGGYFTQAGGMPAGAIASYDVVTDTWSNLNGGMTHPSAASVFALTTDASGNLYAGGQFDSAGGVPAMNVAEWNGSSWSALGAGLGTTSDSVLSLAVNGSDVYAGGSILTPAGYLYHFDGMNWSVVGGGTNGWVTTLALSGSILYVGGYFTQVNSGALNVNYVALWSTITSTWSVIGGGLDGPLGSAVNAIAIGGSGNVYVTGSFSLAGGTNVYNIAVWNGITWLALKDPQIMGGGGLFGSGACLAVNGNEVYAGGTFTQAGDFFAGNLAYWNAVDQQWYAPGNTVNGPVFAIGTSGNDVYVGGNFTSAGGLPARSLALWNPITNTWSAVSAGQLEGCNVAGSCFTVVNAIAANGADIYVGGNFNTAGGVPVNNVARLNGPTWSAMDGGVTLCPTVGCGTEVFALAADGSGVDVGGLFTDAGATTVNNVARWDGSAWHAFTDAGNTNTGTDGQVLAIANDGSGYYFGGEFTTPATNVVHFDGTNWSHGWSAPNGLIQSIVLMGSDLYIGGLFTNAGGNSADYIAVSKNGSDWQPLGSGLDGVVRSMSVRSNNIYVGGNFLNSGGLSLNHIAVWNTGAQSWSNLGSGTDLQVWSLATNPRFIFAGGAFLHAGGKDSEHFASYGGNSIFLPLTMR